LNNKQLSSYVTCLPPLIEGWQVHYFPVLDSTNALLKRISQLVLPTLCFCDIQTNGQGRNGVWRSFVNGNLYLSWAFPTYSFRSSLPLEVALALAEALEDLGVPILLKWPNDFILQGKKVGGLLIEKLSDRLIIGFGLNIIQSVSLASADFPSTSLYEEGFSATRQDFLIPFSQKVIKTVKKSKNDWRTAWQEKDYLANKFITWEEVEQKTGQALGVSSDGALIVEEFGRKRSLYQARKIRIL
jgi:BirA family biotin operon repressor/biotin-[acetyl-CoA-carboxylase] ligase